MEALPLAADGLSATALIFGRVETAAPAYSVEDFRQLLVRAGRARSSPSCRRSRRPCDQPLVSSLAADATGRFLATASRAPWRPRSSSGSSTGIPGCGVAGFGPPVVLGGASTGQPDCESVSVSADGLTTFFASSGAALVAGDTNAAFDVFALDLDGDNDGMSLGWETHFRLSDADPADAALDPDSDGIDEPGGVRRPARTRAACSSPTWPRVPQNGFFSTEIDVFEPATTVPDVGSIVGQFLGQNGRRTVSPILNLYIAPLGGGLFIFSKPPGANVSRCPIRHSLRWWNRRSGWPSSGR